MDISKYKIKSKLNRGDINYLLLSMVEEGHMPEASVSNLVATNDKNQLLWIAELPKTNHDFYWKIYFEGPQLVALSAGGELHEIDKSNGKVLSHQMLK